MFIKFFVNLSPNKTIEKVVEFEDSASREDIVFIYEDWLFDLFNNQDISNGWKQLDETDNTKPFSGRSKELVVGNIYTAKSILKRKYNLSEGGKEYSVRGVFLGLPYELFSAEIIEGAIRKWLEKGFSMRKSKAIIDGTWYYLESLEKDKYSGLFPQYIIEEGFYF
ncbi:MAG: hypothetical protein ACOCQR_00730 [bacterium]